MYSQYFTTVKEGANYHNIVGQHFNLLANNVFALTTNIIIRAADVVIEIVQNLWFYYSESINLMSLDNMEEEQVVACVLGALLLEEDEKIKRDKTRKWINKRTQKGFYANIVKELRFEDTGAYKEIMRMNSYKSINCSMNSSLHLNFYSMFIYSFVREQFF